jgi:uncharacterized Zn finger protein
MSESLGAREPTAVTYTRLPPRRSTARAATWWGRAWVRAVEEASYSEDDLYRARQLARSGAVGQITVDVGGFTAACVDRHDTRSVGGTVPTLDPITRRAFVEVVAGESGHLAALLGGELPHRLVEHAEEAGVELLPYGGELGSACPCESWVDPCVHALAVFLQVAWLIDADPLVLVRLRGLPPDELVAATHAMTQASRWQDSGEAVAEDDAADDLATAMDAATRAARVLALSHDPDAAIDHLL